MRSGAVLIAVLGTLLRPAAASAADLNRSDDGESPATWRRLIGWCVDGVMTARPRAFERVLEASGPPASCGSPS